MSAEQINQRIKRWNTISERLFGEAEEMETAEAEELLKAAGIEPALLKASLYQKMQERSETYAGTGRPVPPLVRKALEDLRPPPARPDREDTGASRTARLAIQHLFDEIAALPQRLSAGFVPVFTAAYRNRTELSARDKKTLDKIARDLRKKAHG
jgi:hypothetical protein